MVDRFPGYWNAGAIKLDRIVYQPLPDTTVRLVNLQAGQLDMVERLGPTDVAAVKQNPKLKLISEPALAYYTLSINLAAHGQPAEGPAGARGARGVDRPQCAQPGGVRRPVHSHQPVRGAGQPLLGPRPSRAAARPGQGEGAAASRRGRSIPSFTLLIGNSPVEQQVGQVIQSMAAEAGFDVKLQAAEANALVAAARAGNYQATIVIWSGRPDPDGNVAIWLACDGFLNWGKYCNPTFDESAGAGARRHRCGRSARRCIGSWSMSISPTGRTSCCTMRNGCGRCRDKVSGFIADAGRA